MNKGHLWHNDSPGTDLAEKIQEAIGHYRRKGHQINMCYVHPSALANTEPFRVLGVRVAALPTVLRHHFWFGLEVME